MAVVGELLVLIGGNSSALTASLAKAEAELKGFSATTAAESGAAATALRGIGFAGLAVAAGTALFGAEAIKGATQFQASMELIHTQAGATQAEVDNLTKSVLDLAPAVGFSPDQLAMGLYHIESAGLRGSAAMDILRIAAEGAKIGHADLETVTNALVAAQFSGIKGTSDMAQAMAVLNTIVGTGNMRMEDLAASFSSGILPAAKIFGLSITDVGAALATMTDQGVPAEEAATRLRMTFSLLGAPTQQAAGLLEGIGLSSRQLADDMRNNGLLFALQDLRAHMVGAGLDATEQAQLLAGAFGGGRSAGTIELLISSLDKLEQKYGAITTGAGTFESAWEATQRTAKQQFDQIAASVDTVVVAIGTGLLPALQPVLSFIGPILANIAHWTTANPQLAAQILLVAGAIGVLAASTLLIGPVLDAIGTVIGIITSPIVLLIGAVVWLAATFGLLGSQAQGMANTVTTYIGEMVPKVIAWFEAMIPQVLATLERLAGQIGTWAGAQIPVIVAQVGRWANAFIDWVGPMIPPALAALGQFAGQVADWIGAQVPLWMAQVGKWGQAFMGWVGPMIPPALAALGEFSSQVLNWIEAQVPGWMAQVGKWASAFMGWVGPMIPPALAALGEFAGQVLNWIIAQIPGWAAQIGKWAGAFIGWVAPMIPPMLGALGQWSASVLNWILAQLPVWAVQIMKWADAFVGWVIPMIPPMLVALAGLGLAIVSWIIGEIPHVVVALAKLAWELVAWIAPKIPGMLLALAGLGLALVGWIITKGIPMAVVALAKLALEFVVWVAKSVPGLLVELGKWLASLLLWLVGIPAKVMAGAMAIGASIMKGIIDGIGHVAGAIGAWLFGTPMPAPPTVPTPSAPSNLNVHAYPPSGSTTLGSLSGSGGFGPDILHYQHGGRVPGTGAQLAIVHGGETVTPAGQSGGAITLVTHTHVSLDGREIMDFVEQQLFRNAGTSSSGFQANNPVTSA